MSTTPPQPVLHVVWTGVFAAEKNIALNNKLKETKLKVKNLTAGRRVPQVLLAKEQTKEHVFVIHLFIAILK